MDTLLSKLQQSRHWLRRFFARAIFNVYEGDKSCRLWFGTPGEIQERIYTTRRNMTFETPEELNALEAFNKQLFLSQNGGRFKIIERHRIAWVDDYWEPILIDEQDQTLYQIYCGKMKV